MFLSSNDLIFLTGYKYAAKQISWLNERGYKYELGADGKPRVLISFVEGILGNRKSRQFSNEPDIQALFR